ncbi:M48 family metallopeptidase [Teredinibacter purpureus]|uniref:M48 family metallopeptidase n=1 Tax=Teredinibacter purpureus TaxID=2731756 RepID=UPI0005F85D66|nr:SprT family zinc-dependent metalloprotease [Teredinibacter purpureus]
MPIFRRRRAVQVRPQSKSQITVAGLSIEVTRKRMKYLRLKVSPPNGDVTLSAPHTATNKEIEAMIRARLDWVIEQQQDIRSQPQTPAPEFLHGDSQRVWGALKTITITRGFNHNKVSLQDDQLQIICPAQTTTQERSQLIDQFYRLELNRALPALIEKWQRIVGREASFWGIKKMKTRWGSCNTQRARIWLNLELAKYPAQCLEYVIVHELVHLYEANHSPRFYRLLDTFMPGWQRWSATLDGQHHEER